MSAIQNAIEVRNLTKIFSGRVLFENFSLNVKANTIHAIIGPNGSGKTTLLRLITGVYQPNAGTINIAGKYAMQLENDYLYDEKTGLENLKIFGKYFGFEINDRSDGYCTQLGLTEHLGKRVSTYSKGMKRKLSLAGEISKDMLQQEKITKRIEWKLANGIKISSIVKENLLSLWIGTLILLFPLLLMISIRLPNLILLLGTYFLILSVLYSAFINVLILWIRNMNWFKSIPIFATLLHILLVVLKCGIFMKTNNVWVLLLFSPVSIIVLTACGLCLMTKERIVSSYY